MNETHDSGLPTPSSTFYSTATATALLTALLVLPSTTGCGRGPKPAGEPVTFDSMLSALTNRTAMALPPREGLQRMVSSYDRAGGNQDWLPNLKPDADGLIELANLRGPGCVVRIWMTGHGYEELHFYVDGERDPRVRRSPRDFFGGPPPFAYPLSGVVSGGSYSYVPIPYAKSLVIKGKWPDIAADNRPYLHVNYFTYPRGTRVESFPRDLTSDQVTRAEDVRRVWEDKVDATRYALLVDLDAAEPLDLAPGATVKIFSEDGEGMLDGFAVALDFPDGADSLARQQVLRDLALNMHWDGGQKPSVAAPLGDFFGNALALRAWNSMFAGHTNGVFYSLWPMPFADGAVGTLRNDGRIPLRVRSVRRLAPRPEGARYFHAAWHHATGQGTPFPILRAEGSGHYAGCYLVSLGADGSWNILEGDESFQVDDDPWPSMHGTGLEDYFNGAWYYFGIFDLPIHGLLEKAAMRTTQYRWHPSDPIPFSRRLSMQIEFGHGNAARGYMSSVAFWYQDEPQGLSPLPTPPRRKPPDPLEVITIMAELFELERIEHLDEAIERCYAYARRAAGTPLADMLSLRAATYRWPDEASVAEMRRMAEDDSKHESVRAQARAWLTLADNDSAALLGIQSSARYRLHLNGELKHEGDDPLTMDVLAINMEAGKHEFTLEATPVRGDAWVSVALWNSASVVRTDDKWEFTSTRPGGWPRTGGDGENWRAVTSLGLGEMLPRISYWQFPPNAFAGKQSAQQLLRPWATWDREYAGRSIYLRRRFDWPPDRGQQ